MYVYKLVGAICLVSHLVTSLSLSLSHTHTHTHTQQYERGQESEREIERAREKERALVGDLFFNFQPSGLKAALYMLIINCVCDCVCVYRESGRASQRDMAS
jgi:hypothetical protein